MARTTTDETTPALVARGVFAMNLIALPPHVTLPGSPARPGRHLLARGLCRGEAADTTRSRVARAEGRGRAAGRGLAIQQARAVAFRAFDESRPRGGVLHGLDNLFRRVGLHIIDGGERAAEAMTDGALWVWGHVHGLGRVARSPFPRRAHESTLDAELNDFGAQLAMLGGHAADSDG